MQQLTNGTLLQGGKYKIERVLGQGGFGITYLAYQEMLDRRVCIKEFFFKDFCERNADTSRVTLGTTNSKELVQRFLAKFVKEARTIAKFHHPNIISIIDIFEENGTAYYVMEFIEGESLSEKVKRDGALSEQQSVAYINKVADALAYVHERKINHLDVKPANIMVRKADNEPVLIDFGLAKQYDAETGNQTSTTPVGISHGYAPIEQYRQGGVSEFSPQTDVYSLGATLYKLVTGVNPPQATELVSDEDVLTDGLKSKSVSKEIVSSIVSAMQPSIKKRYHTIIDFKNSLPTNISFAKQEGKSEVVVDNGNGEMICEETEIMVTSDTDSVEDGKNSDEGRDGTFYFYNNDDDYESEDDNEDDDEFYSLSRTISIILCVIACWIALWAWLAS